MESAELDVTLAMPLAVLWNSLAEQLRKLEPLTPPPTLPVVGVLVAPKRIDAPDIVKVAVLVRGSVIQPLASTLNATVLKTAMGATVTEHAGSLLFPKAAFAPPSDVQFVIIPDSGQNIEVTVSKERFAALDSGKVVLASTLIGLADAEVKQRLGRPTDETSTYWRYLRGDARLYVYFNESKHVSDVNPKDFDLATLSK